MCHGRNAEQQLIAVGRIKKSSFSADRQSERPKQNSHEKYPSEHNRTHMTADPRRLLPLIGAEPPGRVHESDVDGQPWKKDERLDG